MSELLDKRDKKLTIDEETKIFLRRLKIEKMLLMKRNLRTILVLELELLH